MGKIRTLGEVLRINKENFNPMNLDTSSIRALSNEIPKDGNLDLANAEVLATKFLRGADMASELVAIATLCVSRAKDLKSQAFNRAFLVKSESNPKLKTDKLRLAFAELDEDYIEACDRYNQAVAFLRWIGSRYDAFVRSHYLLKKILEREYSGEKAANWNGTMPDGDDGDWKDDLDKSQW
jgi:hypothetical protein